jgi:hypothetical protein
LQKKIEKLTKLKYENFQNKNKKIFWTRDVNPLCLARKTYKISFFAIYKLLKIKKIQKKGVMMHTHSQGQQYDKEPMRERTHAYVRHFPLRAANLCLS